MKKFFQKWREFSLKVANVGLIWFGIVALIGAARIFQQSGPVPLSIVFAIAGLLMIGVGASGIYSRKS